ncbi:MAG: UbiA family prenyltransferase [Planctomycetota bacterium]|jgi:4-hydroxybenzoate polyprenyltransferase
MAIEMGTGRFYNYISMMRLDHWHKNLFVVPGILAAWKYSQADLRDFNVYIPAALGILIACLASSVNYTLNEVLDAKFDKYHPFKRNRPAVKGDINPVFAVVLAFLLLVVVLFLSLLFLPKAFTYTLIAFWVSGLIYNVPPIRTKDIAFLDTAVESVNNPIRLALGWFCCIENVLPPASALIAYWCLAGFMMTAKRFSEYSVFDDDNSRINYRKSFRTYTRPRLINFICFWVSFFSLTFGIFVIRVNTNAILVFPFIAVFFAWYMKLAFEKDSVVQEPERMFKRPLFFLYSFSVFVLLMAILFLGERITIMDWVQKNTTFLILP